MRWALLGFCVLVGCTGEAFSTGVEESGATGGDAGEPSAGEGTGGTGGAFAGGRSGSAGKATGGADAEGGEPATGGTETSGGGGSAPMGGTDSGGSSPAGGTNTGGIAGCEETTAFYPDDDGDGYGAPGGAVDSCEAPVGFIERGDDCDDSTEAKHPGAVERCDGVDLDCDPSNATVDCPAGCSPLALESASYLVCGAVKDWPSARAFCDEMGMTLAKVRSATDQAAVEAAASPHGNIYWLGASDGLTEGTWRWETDAAGLASGFSLWAPQEPKALFDDQDCMNGYFGRWYSARCSNAYPFVCEFID